MICRKESGPRNLLLLITRSRCVFSTFRALRFKRSRLSGNPERIRQRESSMKSLRGSFRKHRIGSRSHSSTRPTSPFSKTFDDYVVDVCINSAVIDTIGTSLASLAATCRLATHPRFSVVAVVVYYQADTLVLTHVTLE